MSTTRARPTEEKLLASKDGAVAQIIFNNPARHNAVSLEMWQRMQKLLTEFAADPELRVLVVSGAGGKAFVSGADISKFESERASEEAVKVYNATSATAYEQLDNFPKPDHRQDPGLLHRRRRQRRRLLRSARLHGGCQVRHPRRQARPRLRLYRRQPARRNRRRQPRDGAVLYGAPGDRAGGLRHGPRQPRGAGRRDRCRDRRVDRHDRRERADDDRHHQGRRARDRKAREQARSRPRSTAWSRPASSPPTTSKAAAPSWKSASRSSKASNEPR